VARPAATTFGPRGISHTAAGSGRPPTGPPPCPDEGGGEDGTGEPAGAPYATGTGTAPDRPCHSSVPPARRGVAFSRLTCRPTRPAATPPAVASPTSPPASRIRRRDVRRIRRGVSTAENGTSEIASCQPGSGDDTPAPASMPESSAAVGRSRWSALRQRMIMGRSSPGTRPRSKRALMMCIICA
jgi:hypothetical protein